MSGATRDIDWSFVAWWMLAFLGFPLGGLLAIEVVGAIDGPARAALAGFLAGSVIGAAQWLVLRRYLRISTWWVVATAAGLASGNAIGAVMTGAGTELGDLVLTGLAAGVAVGLAQWTLLSAHLRIAILWPLVVTIAWPIGWTVTWAAGVDVERGYAVFGATGALVFAALTGTAMWLLMRGTARAGLQRSAST